jgi:DNA-binding CsgD family transcriptional regulator
MTEKELARALGISVRTLWEKRKKFRLFRRKE